MRLLTQGVWRLGSVVGRDDDDDLPFTTMRLKAGAGKLNERSRGGCAPPKPAKHDEASREVLQSPAHIVGTGGRGTAIQGRGARRCPMNAENRAHLHRGQFDGQSATDR